MKALENIALVKPTIKHQAGYIALIDESEAVDGDYVYNNVPLARADFAAFVQELEDEANGIGLPPGVVPQQTYLLVGNGTEVLGEFRYRPTVQEPYEEQNGHIGANLRPSVRGQDNGTIGLTLMLEMARADGLKGVLLPIKEDNYPSIALAMKKGAYLLRKIEDAETGEVTASYWIDLST